MYLRVLGPRSRSQLLFTENHCHGSSTFIKRLILILYHTNDKYDNISDKFKFEGSRAKVKVTVAIKKKHCHCSIAFINQSILIYLPTNVKYDNILNNFEFAGSRAKVKVTVAIFRKTLSLLYHLHLWTNFAVTSHTYLV